VAHVNKSPPPLHTLAPNTPRPLCDIVDRCLAKEPASRYQNCDELVSALLDASPIVEREMASRATRAASAPPPPALVSDTEAHEILGRAADLQAMTGIQPAPPAIVNREPRRDPSRSSGYRMDELRDAAVEAGIPAKYVDRAMAEHGLGDRGPHTPAIIDRTPRGRGWNSLSGYPTSIEFEVVVDGEMPEDDFDLLVDIIRAQTGEAGIVSAVGRSFAWQTHPGKRNMQVSVFPRNGRTTIRVSESLRGAAGGLFGGIIGGVGGGSMGIWGGMAGAMHAPLFGLTMWAGTVAASYVTARGFFGMVSRRRDRVLRTLAERLAAAVQESIAAARQRAGAAARPRIR
jgi:serine/threonine-protein kinase